MLWSHSQTSDRTLPVPLSRKSRQVILCLLCLGHRRKFTPFCRNKKLKVAGVKTVIKTLIGVYDGNAVVLSTGIWGLVLLGEMLVPAQERAGFLEPGGTQG